MPNYLWTLWVSAASLRTLNQCVQFTQNNFQLGITPYIVPKETDLRWAADTLNRGKKVAILVGAGALSARDEIVEIAELLQAGVAKALLGKAAVEDTLPYVTGSIGMLGTQASEEMMRNCDTLLMIGSNFPYAEFLPKPGSARGVQIDINAQNISLRYPMDVGLVGDAAATLKELIPLIERKDDNTWREQVLGFVSKSTRALYEQAHAEGDPLNPQQVFFDLNKYLPERCIITADSGTSTVWYARHLKMRAGMMGSVSGGLASMGCSLPYAIAAKFAYPDRSVIACTGDGAMQMIGNNELITISKYWKKWSNPQLVIIVLKNKDLSFVTWEQRAHEGDPKFTPSQNVIDFPYAKHAQSLGLDGYLIESANQIESVLKYAMSANRPVVIEVLADPDIPPVPPNAGFKESVNLVQSVSKSDEAEHKPVWQSIAQAFGNMFR
ncbi:MAG: thiamine pyrophosphate-dependent enzyme [Candidatus Melainabacteria bacterium]|nr:thiamine pyrophosphate-dependent enzyme [Candidatus Melainabacteria bacterium]